MRIFSMRVIWLTTLKNSKKPLSIPVSLAKILLKRSMYDLITASVRIARDEIIGDWETENTNFIEGMTKILYRKRKIQKPAG